MSVKEIDEYYKIVYFILENDEFIKRKKYEHHGKKSVYDHSLEVSKKAYIWSKRLHLDYKSAAIGGLLHDFYFDPWKEIKEKRPFFKKHGFTHAREATVNSYHYFLDSMNNKVENIILRHMFPVNIIPPKYKEAWIVSLADKYVSFEVIKKPKILLQFFGYKKR